jgi:hypothetical protein
VRARERSQSSDPFVAVASSSAPSAVLSAPLLAVPSFRLVLIIGVSGYPKVPRIPQYVRLCTCGQIAFVQLFRLSAPALDIRVTLSVYGFSESHLYQEYRVSRSRPPPCGSGVQFRPKPRLRALADRL